MISRRDEYPRGARALSNVAAVAVMGAIVLAASLVVPGEALNGGMWLFFFATTVFYAFYLWGHRDWRSFTARQWAGKAALFAGAFAIVWGAGAVYAYTRGVRDDASLLFGQNGGFLLAVVLGMPLVLSTLGGSVRALVYRAASPSPGK